MGQQYIQTSMFLHEARVPRFGRGRQAESLGDWLLQQAAGPTLRGNEVAGERLCVLHQRNRGQSGISISTPRSVEVTVLNSDPTPIAVVARLL